MSGEKNVQSLCLRKKILKASRGLQKNSRIESFSHPLPPVICNDSSLTWGDTEHLFKNAYYLHVFVLHWCATFRLQDPCMLAAQILKPHGILCVVPVAFQCCSLVNKQHTIQKNSNLQPLYLRQIGKYPRRKLFDLIVVQIPE